MKRKIYPFGHPVIHACGGRALRGKVYMAFLMALILGTVAGCGQNAKSPENTIQTETAKEDGMVNEKIEPVTEITELDEGLSVVRYEGDYGFGGFLEQGGAESDEGVVEYLSSQLMSNIPELLFGGNPFGCSTLSVQNTDGGNLFGRNFDWNTCNALIISSRPDNGYASVSTVNMDFIQAGGLDISRLPDTAQAIIGLYAPNTWNFTRLGKVQNLSAAELKKVLGKGNISVTLTLENK